MSYLSNYYKALGSIKYLSVGRDVVQKQFEQLDEIHKSYITTKTMLKTYDEYTISVHDLEAQANTTFKNRSRLDKRLSTLFYDDFPNDLLQGEKSAILYLNYLYDSSLTGKYDPLIFKDVFSSIEVFCGNIPTEMDQGKLSFNILEYINELSLLKEFTQSSLFTKLESIDLKRMQELVNTLSNLNYNSKLFSEVVLFLLKED